MIALTLISSQIGPIAVGFLSFGIVASIVGAVLTVFVEYEEQWWIANQISAVKEDV